MFSQMGAIVSGDFQQWVANNKGLESLIDTSITPAKMEDENIVFTKEFMAQLKELLDQYAEENQPYFVKSTRKANQIPASAFTSKTAYNEFINYSKSHYMFFFRKNGNGFYVYDFTPEFKEGGGFYNAWRYPAVTCNKILAVDSDWNTWDSKKWYFDYYEFNKNADGDMVLDTVHEKYSYYTSNAAGIDITPDRIDFQPAYTNNNFVFLVTQDGGNIRIYQSIADLQNYSVGQRKVYYTSNYYDYVPEDLTVSIDELQKTIEDMQDVIDRLLDLITDNTSESEIEELLRQILEELRSNPGSGSGSGSGGGDINVDIDLSTTNSLLSKILAKVTQIFDKMSETAGGAVDAVSTKLQETLDEILGTLKSIRRWTIADTVFDGLDALADIASFLKDFLTAPAAAIGTAASSLGETADMLTDKFPFSIPWDMAALVTLLSAEPQAPVFRLPIVIESYGIEEYIEIDMSQFEALSTIMRGMLSIIYAYGILSMTTKVIDIGGKK